ncbi:N-6 DNA methylase [Pseudomonas aeruginosa]
MDINEEIFRKLIEPARALGADAETVALTLMLVAWQQRDAGAPDASPRLQDQQGKELSEALATFEKVPELSSFEINDGVRQRAKRLRKDPGLLDRVTDLYVQGLLSAWIADDTYAWLNNQDWALGLPPSLADLLIELIAPEPNSELYIPWDYSGQLAARAVRRNARVALEMPITNFASHVLTLTGKGGWRLHASDPVRSPGLEKEGRLKPFQAAVAVPPMGIRYDKELVGRDPFDRFVERTNAGNILQLRHLMAQTTGRIAVVVPNTVLFSVGAERSFRQSLVEQGLIETVIALPNGLMELAIPVALLILNTEKPSRRIRFIDATSDEFQVTADKRRVVLRYPDALAQLARSSTSHPRVIDIQPAQVREHDYNLEAGRYLLGNVAQQQARSLQNLPLGKLSEHFEIIRARQHATSTSGVPVREIQAADVPDYGATLSASKESLFDLNSPRAEAYFLRPQDVLLAIKGSVGKVGIVFDAPEAGEGGWLAGQSFVVLRAKENTHYSPVALLLFLRSALGQTLLKSQVVGASMPTLQLASIKDLSIPQLGQDELNTITSVFQKEIEIQREIHALYEQQAQLSADIWMLT